jgi:3-phenylpropionate/cinnamic acid dioxygenase small subunit
MVADVGVRFIGYASVVTGPADLTDETVSIDAVRRTLAQYCQLCDEGRWDDFVDLFVADARFHVMGRTSVGPDAIRGFMEVGQSPERRGRHMISGSVIEIAEGGSAALAWTDYVFVAQSKLITSVGRYHDELVRGHDGRWRFAAREIVFMGDQPEIAQPPPG